MNRYSDIINLQHHKSKNHPPMSRQNRAAQFSPFAALTGYEESLEIAAREKEKEFEEKHSGLEEDFTIQIF